MHQVPVENLKFEAWHRNNLTIFFKTYNFQISMGNQEEKKNKGNDRKAVEGSRHDPHVASSNEPQKKKHKVSHDLAANKNGQYNF